MREIQENIKKLFGLCFDFLICIYFHIFIANHIFCHEIDVFYIIFLRSIQTLIDPYEQKLFHLFSSHENGHGIIDELGLNNLVQTLQLKERGSVLTNLLLKNGSRSGVTFKEFREALLQVITSEDDGMEAA